MTGSGAALALGFLLGLRHAADADHVVAVSTLVSRRQGAAWLLGAVWGLGHSTTIFAVGALIVLGKISISAPSAARLEGLVGALLIALGAWTIARRDDDEVTAHRHDSEPPHLHLPTRGWLEKKLREAGPGQLARSAAVGLVHGLAGSAAAALLVMTAIPGPRTALLYLVLFGLGTMIGMLLLSAAMAYCMARLAGAWTPARRGLTTVTGALSAALGASIVLRAF